MIPHFASFLAQAAETAAPAVAPAADAAAPQGGAGGSLLFLVLILVGMWFLLIAPQRRRQKEQQKMLAALGEGDKVITVGGIMGTIRKVNDDTYTLQIDDGVQIKVLKPYIQGRQPEKSAAAQK